MGDMTDFFQAMIGEKVGDYILTEVLAIGTYGAVFCSEHEKTEMLFAVKCLLKEGLSQKQLEFQKFEIAINRQLGKHANICNLITSVETGDYLFLVFEYCASGDLFEAIRSRKITQERAQNYILQLITAVEYCHTRGVFHRDLKPENVLLAKETLKIADFGLATNEPNPSEIGVGSPPYMGPELFDANLQSYSAAKADVWALGVIFFNLLFQVNPWERAVLTDPYFEAHVKNPTGSLKRRFDLSDDLNSIFTAIFQIDYKKRCSLKELRSKIMSLDLGLPASSISTHGLSSSYGNGNVGSTPPSSLASSFSSAKTSLSVSPSPVHNAVTTTMTMTTTTTTTTTPMMVVSSNNTTTTTVVGFQTPTKQAPSSASAAFSANIPSNPSTPPSSNSNNNGFLFSGSFSPTPTPMHTPSSTPGTTARPGGSALSHALASSPSKPIVHQNSSTSIGKSATSYSGSTPKSSFMTGSFNSEASFKSAVSSLKFGSSPMGITGHSFKNTSDQPLSSSVASSWADDDMEMDFDNVPNFDSDHSTPPSARGDSPNSLSSPSLSKSQQQLQSPIAQQQQLEEKQQEIPQSDRKRERGSRSNQRQRDDEKQSSSPQQERRRSKQQQQPQPQPQQQQQQKVNGTYPKSSNMNGQNGSDSEEDNRERFYDANDGNLFSFDNEEWEGSLPNLPPTSSFNPQKQTQGQLSNQINSAQSFPQNPRYQSNHQPPSSFSPKKTNGFSPNNVQAPPTKPQQQQQKVNATSLSNTSQETSSTTTQNHFPKSQPHPFSTLQKSSNTPQPNNHQGPKVVTGFSVAAPTINTSGHSRKKSGGSPFSPSSQKSIQTQQQQQQQHHPAEIMNLSFLPSVASSVALEEIAHMYDFANTKIAAYQ